MQMLIIVNFVLWWSADPGILPGIMNEFSRGSVGYHIGLSVGSSQPESSYIFTIIIIIIIFRAQMPSNYS